MPSESAIITTGQRLCHRRGGVTYRYPYFSVQYISADHWLTINADSYKQYPLITNITSGSYMSRYLSSTGIRVRASGTTYEVYFPSSVPVDLYGTTTSSGLLRYTLTIRTTTGIPVDTALSVKIEFNYQGGSSSGISTLNITIPANNEGYVSATTSSFPQGELTKTIIVKTTISGTGLTTDVNESYLTDLLNDHAERNVPIIYN